MQHAKKIKMAIAAFFMAATVMALPASGYAQELVPSDEPAPTPLMGLMGTMYGSPEEIDDVATPPDEEDGEAEGGSQEGEHREEEGESQDGRDDNEPGLAGVTIYTDRN